MSSKLAENNYYVSNNDARTLETLEFTEQSKLNELSKRLLLQNRKVITNAIIRIGTLLAYPRNIALFILFFFSFNLFAQTEKKEQKQCKGITKKGVQCKRMLSANNKSNYCYQHLKQSK